MCSRRLEAMNILLLGNGKTGSLVAEVARERRHTVEILRSVDNPHGSALTADRLSGVDTVIDFTTPHAVLNNIEACLNAGKNMVVGTTGWTSDLPRIQQIVKNSGHAFMHGANFSIGVNLFYEVARAAAAALHHQYSGQIFERHHAHKNDAPSGTAITVQKVIQEASGEELEITSFREGEVVGLHELILDSPHDRIYLCHDAKSRRGFAEGAVRGAEWLQGHTGCFDFKDVWRKL
jgi:4-hydroxy-tetrahydrodipicolinate reductase